MKYLFGLVIAISISLLVSCDESDDPAPFKSNPPELIAEGNTGDGLFKVELYSSTNLMVGYNELEFKVLDGEGNAVWGLDYLIKPMMDMGMHMHACPVIFPNDRNGQEGRMPFDLIFQMPSDGQMTWSLGITIIQSGVESKVEFPIEVVPSDEKRVFSFVHPTDSMGYFVALKNPSAPEVGVNPLQLVLFQRKSMMEWPMVEDMIMEFEPSMPSMGHGSPNNVNPISMGEGVYEGKVNFTMTGLWQLDVKVMDGSDEIGLGYLEIDF